MKFIPACVLFIFFFNATAQPSGSSGADQAMDVRGKLKIGNDGSTPSEGTMRYTSAMGFEGYNGNSWQSLMASPMSFFPSNAIPVYAHDNLIQAGSSDVMTFYDWDHNSYSSIPENKMIVVTGIYPRPNSNMSTNDFYAMTFTLYYFTGTAFSNTRLQINGYDNQQEYITGDTAPLFVIKPGFQLRSFNFSNSAITMSVSMRGFLVDDPSN